MMHRTSGFKNISLSKKIILGFILFILVPLAGLGYVYYDKSRDLVEERLANANWKSVSDFNTYYLEQMNRNMDIFLKIWVDNNDLNQIFISRKVKARYEKEIASALMGYPEITSVFLGTEKGEFFIEPMDKLPSDYDPRNRPWYKLAMDNPDKLVWTEPYNDVGTSGFVFTIAKQVKQADGSVLGVMAIDVRLSELSTIMSEVKFGKSGYLMLADSKGQMISSPDAALLGIDIRTKDWAKGIYGNDSGSFTYKMDGKSMVVSYLTNQTTGWKLIGLIPKDELQEQMIPLQALMIRVILYVGLWALVAVICMVVYIRWLMVKPLHQLMAMMAKVESGDLTVTSEYDRKDEIGQLFNSFKHMVQGQRDILVQVLVTATKLNAASEQTSVIAKQSTETAQSQSFAMQELTKSIEDMSTAIVDVTNNMTDIAQIMGTTMISMREMGSAASEVSENTIDTAEAISDVVDSLREMDASISRVSQHAQTANAHGANSMAIVHEGKQIVDTTMREMDQVNVTMKALSQVIINLGKSAEQIGEIVEVIDDISEQTNLLSLNASIEAARAGENGKGFAVVASAIGRLSEKSSESTKDIERLIKQIQVIVKEAVDSAEKSANSIEIGVRLVNQTEAAFTNIFETISETTQLLGEIASSTEEQATASKAIMEASVKVNELTMHVSAASQEELATIEEVVSTSERVNMLTQEASSSTSVQAANSEELMATSLSLNEMTMEVTAMSNEVDQIATELNTQSRDLVSLVSKFKL